MSLIWLGSWSLPLPFLLLTLGILTYFFVKTDRALWGVSVLVLALLALRLFETNISFGSSFYILMMIGFLVDQGVNKRDSVPLENFILQSSFFPTLMAGPVTKSQNFSDQLASSDQSVKSVIDGILIFAIGFLKIQYLVLPFNEASLWFLGESAWWGVVIASLFATLGLYLSLSSFSDMGRGCARMFGLNLDFSFRPIIFSADPSDFWQRWNRTIAQWFRDYLVLPSLLKWGRRINANVILFLSFLLLGLWHGLSLNWLVFGAFNGALVILGSFLNKKGIKYCGRFLVLVILIGNGLLHLGERIFIQNIMREGSLPQISLILIFIAFECLQEKFKDNDFYLRAPYWLKSLIAISLVLAWIFFADHQNVTNPKDLPLYFNL